MLRRLLRYASLLLLLILAAFTEVAVAASPDRQPQDILTGIYKEAVKDNTAWLEAKHRGQYLSKSLLARWAKAEKKNKDNEEGALIDWDLTTDTNGLELADFVITTKSQSETAAVLAVKLIYREPYLHKGPPKVVTYDFIREGGSWRIDNMRGLEWSLRDILKQ
jgi:hypothetical protein